VKLGSVGGTILTSMSDGSMAARRDCHTGLSHGTVGLSGHTGLSGQVDVRQVDVRLVDVRLVDVRLVDVRLVDVRLVTPALKARHGRGGTDGEGTEPSALDTEVTSQHAGTPVGPQTSRNVVAAVVTKATPAGRSALTCGPRRGRLTATTPTPRGRLTRDPPSEGKRSISTVHFRSGRGQNVRMAGTSGTGLWTMDELVDRVRRAIRWYKTTGAGSGGWLAVQIGVIGAPAG
jgi:hypothetical protein